jgi:hypothetical protein
MHTPDPSKPTGCSCNKPGCDKPGKHPRTSHGCHDATTDEETICGWWRHWPDANVGIATGKKSGVWALDVDGEAGAATLAELQRQHGELPETMEQRSGSGGRHLFFGHVPGLTNAVKFAPGLDVRTDGGLIVAAPSVHQSGGRYEWREGHGPGEIRPANAPSWLTDLIRQRNAESRGDRGTTAEVGDTIPDGERNATLASFAGTMRRRGMGRKAIEEALLAENALKCDPPLDEDEVRQIAANIARYEPAPETPSREPGSRLGNPGGHARADGWPDAIREPAMIGVLGEFVRLVAPHTEADPNALLVQALVAAGNVIGGDVRVRNGRLEHPLNLYTVVVGQTSKARKGTALYEVERLFQTAEPDWRERVLRGLSSGEGLIHRIRDPRDQEYIDKDTGEVRVERVDEGVEDKRLVVVAPEFARVLRQNTREGNILADVLRELWDSGNVEVPTRNNPLKATGAHVSLMGHCTMADLAHLMRPADRGNGYANRILWCCARRSKNLAFGGEIPREEAELQARLRRALARARGLQGPITLADDARGIWKAIYDAEVHREEGEGVADRGEPIMLRIAGIYAALDASNFIRPEHLLAAAEVWRYCRESALYIFGRRGSESSALPALPETRQQIRDAIRATGRYLEPTEITQATGKNDALIRQTLRRMLKDEQVLHDAGKYGLADTPRADEEDGPRADLPPLLLPVEPKDEEPTATAEQIALPEPPEFETPDDYDPYDALDSLAEDLLDRMRG